MNNFNCEKTWNLFAEGKTKGIFQLESNLGKSWAKKVEPKNIEELAALISLIRPGCISGDTFITISKYTHKDGKNRFIRQKIRDIYNSKNKPTEIFSLNESDMTVVKNQILDIFYSGQKECFKVKIRKYSMSSENTSHKTHPSWYDLECTSDHKLFTNKGWIELKDLQHGDRIACFKKQNNRDIRQSTISNRYTKHGPRMKNISGTRYFSEICYKHYEEQCVMCEWKETTLDVHHIDGNRHTNNHFNNLVYLCPNCHRLHNNNKLSKEEIILRRNKYTLPKSNEIEWVTYLGKESVGVKDTYDISMLSPNHNFIAGNFIVHNCLKAYTDGKSMAQHYVDRKHGRDKVVYLHESLADILKSTYGVILYQEQAMLIAQKLAGFNLQEADDLRKAIGKKKADLMIKIKEKFISGCAKTKLVTEEIAQEIFSWIEKSSRYSFNKSHAVAYAVNAYISAWYKANHTKEFFLSWLHFSSEKQDPQKEISELVAEAKLFDIKINIPNIDIFDKKFFIKNGIIYFGIKDIKSLSGVTGDNVISTIKNTESELEKSSSEFSWMDILIYLSPKINSTAFKALCAVGFFCNSSTSISRNTAIYEYLIFQRLTKTELEWVKSNYATKKWASLLECFTDLAPTKKNGGGTSREDRSQVIYNEIHFLKNPPYCLDDSPLWIITEEAKILGCPISLSSIESSDISFANTSCKEIINGKTGESLCVAGNIKRLSACKVKKGKTKGETMCFVTIEDDTCSVDNLVIFPVTYKEYEFVLYEGNNLLFCGKISKNGDSFIVDKIHEI